MINNAINRILMSLVLMNTLVGSDALADNSIDGKGSGYSVELACSSAETNAKTKADAFCRKRPDSELSKFYGIGKNQQRVDDQHFTCVYHAGFTCR